MRALIQIRPAEPADAEIAAVLLYSAYTHTQITFPLREELERGLIERLEHFFRQDGNRFSYQNIQVAEENSAVVGLVLSFGGRDEARLNAAVASWLEREAEDDEWYVDALAVFSNWGRKGIGTCLLQRAEQQAREHHYLKIALHQTGGCRTRNPHLMGAIDRQLWDNRHADPVAIEQEFRGEKGRGWLLRWLPSRAHDNGVFVVFANGVGVDDDEIRTGNAMVLDPYGRILTETWTAADAMVVADLDGALLEHATGRGWIAARRPDLYRLLIIRTGRERDTRELKFEE
jgi:GNAT superfamily N-acetyltransferase